MNICYFDPINFNYWGGHDPKTSTNQISFGVMIRSHQTTSDGHLMDIRQNGFCTQFFFYNGWKLFFKDFKKLYIFERFYVHFILLLLCCVIYFSLFMWHTRCCLDPISIFSASDVCQCCIVLYMNPFCPMAIRWPSDVKYFWCEQAIKGFFSLN